MQRNFLLPLLLLSVAVGLLYRLFPLVAGPEALARFFITEDGYLLLTVARNMAIGNGMSVSAGEILTNGVQPLATFLYAIPYALTDGEKLASLAGVLMLMTAISGLAFWGIRGLARGVLGPQDPAPVWPWLVAALWFIGPLLLAHSMNALETGLYTFMVVATVWYFGRLTATGEDPGVRDRILFGSLCGLTFLARNDAVFLIAALFALRFLQVSFTAGRGPLAAVREALLPGMISLIWAAPWLVNNQLLFGSIVPISGTAQSLAAEFGQNLPAVPAKLFEHMFPMLPVPRSLETSLALLVAGSVGVVAVLALFLWRSWRRRNPYRLAMTAYTLYGLLLVAYYGLLFGAEHFLGRYLAPLAPLLILAAVSVGLGLAARLPGGGQRGARLAGAGALVLSIALLVRLALPGVKEHEHFQVVEWVNENVAETTWVGAVQTGTLGYWHDRTINLDGKVNPAALAARRERGNVLAYVVDSPIDYLADWVEIATWVDRSDQRFSDTFEVLVRDPQANLGVLKRRSE